jgi:hypothetical protein
MQKAKKQYLKGMVKVPILTKKLEIRILVLGRMTTQKMLRLMVPPPQ